VDIKGVLNVSNNLKIKIIHLSKNLLLAIGSLVLFFTITEFTIRLFKLNQYFDTDFKFYIRNIDNDLRHVFMQEDAFLMWSPRPGYSDHFITINSHGLRDKEYTYTKPKNVFRILCLGDSCTFGLGVSISKTYHSLLENKLNQEYPTDKIRYEVINAGCTGYTSSQGLSFYRLKGRHYKPDIVVCYFGNNEVVKQVHLSDRNILYDSVPYGLKFFQNQVLLRSALYRLMRKFIIEKVGKKDTKEAENVARVSIEDYGKNILMFEHLCKKSDSEVIFLAAPISKNAVFAGKPKMKDDIILYRKFLEEMAKEHNLHMLKIAEMTELSEMVGSDRIYFQDVSHPTEMGHELIMNRLYEYLVANQLLPEPFK